jgi:predicted Zn-dependent peptidase
VLGCPLRFENGNKALQMYVSISSMRKLFLSAFLSASFVCASVGPEGVSEWTLENGMRFVLVREPGASQATFATYVEAGGARETHGITGLNQVLRRAALKTISKLRVASNADFFFRRRDLPAQEAGKWFAAEAAWFANPDLTGFKEAQAEQVAMRQKHLTTGAFLLDELGGTGFFAHPYGFPTFGFPGDLEKLTEPDARGFVRRFHVPSNTVGLLYGDLDAAEMKHLSKLHFGKLPAVPRPEPVRTVEAAQRVERRVRAVTPDQAALLVGFHKEGVDKETYPAWDAVAWYLNAVVGPRLKNERKLVTRFDAHVGFPAMKHPALFTIVAFAAPESRNDDIEAAIFEALESIKHGVIGDRELDDMRGAMLKGELRLDGDSLLHMADWLSMTGDWRNIFDHRDRLRAVKPEDVQRLAQKTFVPTNRTVVSGERSANLN